MALPTTATSLSSGHTGAHDNVLDVAAYFGTTATAIKDAVTVAAANPGTRLYFGPYTWTIATSDLSYTDIGLGTLYTTTGFLVRCPSDTTFYGPGTISITGVPAEGYVPPLTNHYAVFAMGGGETNVRFEELTFQGQNNFTFYSGNQSAPIRVYSDSAVSEVSVVGCRFRNLYGFALQAEGTVSRVNVKDCDLYQVSNSINNNADYAMVEGNTFTSSAGTECSGIGAKIVGNTFKTCKTTAISLGGRTAADSVGVVRGCVVAHNDIDGSTGTGVIIADGVRGAVISDNNITRCDTGAISMTSSTGYPPSDCVFSGNAIYGNCLRGTSTSAVTLGSGGYHKFIGNYVFDETSSSSYWQQQGLNVYATNHYIAGNSIYTSDRFGTSVCIALQNASTAQISANDMAGTANLVTFAGSAALIKEQRMFNAGTDVLLETLYGGGVGWKMLASGKIQWSELYGSYDTSIERSAANVLSTGSDDAIKTGASTHGSLPAPSGYAAGAQFYCTTDKKPVWSDGSTHWVDAAGANHT